MGFKVTFNGPGTVEEYDTKAGKLGTCLEDAIDNTIYRSTLPELQDAILPIVKEFTGLDREVNTAQTEKNKSRAKDPSKVKDVMETVPNYVKRAIASLDEAKVNELGAKIQEAANKIEIDPSPSKRKAGIPKEFLAKADSVLTLGPDAIEAKVTDWLARVPGFEVERDENNVPTRESLANLAGEVIKTL